MDENWVYTILDADFGCVNLNSFFMADLDGCGLQELIAGGEGALYWYDRKTGQKYLISKGNFSVGLLACDIDGDGQAEVVAAQLDPTVSSRWMVSVFKPGADIFAPWNRSILDDRCSGLAHDILFEDVDGDGQAELLVNAVFCSPTGIYFYKRDAAGAWHKHTVVENINTEGLSVGDLDGDGQPEIVSGPDYYKVPKSGPCSGRWNRVVYAPNMREFCRTALVDITGNGRLDIVALESEYMDGRLCWFENRMADPFSIDWTEHELMRGLVYAHSLSSGRDGGRGAWVFAAEMEQGGWDAPYNHDARLIYLDSSDHGNKWRASLIAQGEGTHQAVLVKEANGIRTVYGKTWGNYWHDGKLQMWTPGKAPALTEKYQHMFVDRDKPHTATDILSADVNGDGLPDIICGRWWYKNPSWERQEIPYVCQIIQAGDIDGDGIVELIGIRSGEGNEGFYNELSSRLCWLKPSGENHDQWACYDIGTGHGDWPHGSLLANVLPEGRLALIVAYHNASEGMWPELFEVPDDPRQGPWLKRKLAEIPYGESMAVCDINQDGQMDIAAGAWWLENMGDGTFKPHAILEDFHAARTAVMGVDILLGEEGYDPRGRITPRRRLMWCRNPGKTEMPWDAIVIDSLRHPHSLSTGDFDGDGETEILCAEHDPCKPYRSRCGLYLYKRSDLPGNAWERYALDTRFEHHCGVIPVDLGEGRIAIASHGWAEGNYVHLWQPASCCRGTLA